MTAYESSSLNKPSYLFRSGKASYLAQEVWGNKTTQEGQMVVYFKFAIVAFTAIRVVCILGEHNVCVYVLHE